MFFNERCPNCGKPISKEAGYCNACGCESATGFVECGRCKASIGSDSKFCWKCGLEQNLAARRQVFGDRWFRSPTDFAVRVEISSPKEVLQQGLQIDEGTVALIFQDGGFKGLLNPGFHTFNGFLDRLMGFNPGHQSHAILLDTRSAEVDFELTNVRTVELIPVDMRLRLLFSVTDPREFVSKVIGSRASFQTTDLAALFAADVADAIQTQLRDVKAEDLMVEPRARERVEAALLQTLAPTLAAYGLRIDGVRLARFGGQAIDGLSEKLGQLAQLNREFEATRDLRDASRREKVEGFRDELQLEEAFAQVSHEIGLQGAEREQERRRWMQLADHKFQSEGLAQDYERRKAEILNRLDEQTLQHRSQLADVAHELEVRGQRFAKDLEEARARGDFGRHEQRQQAAVDRELAHEAAKNATDVATEGLKAWKMVEAAKAERDRARNDEDLRLKRETLELFGQAETRTLLTLLSGEQADRVLKLAELEMRQGMSEEKALAMVAEKAPEMAPAIAEALKARYQAQSGQQPNA